MPGDNCNRMKPNYIPTQSDSSFKQLRPRATWKRLSQQEESHRNTGRGWGRTSSLPDVHNLISSSSFYRLLLHLCRICSLTSPSFVIITSAIYQVVSEPPSPLHLHHLCYPPVFKQPRTQLLLLTTFLSFGTNYTVAGFFFPFFFFLKLTENQFWNSISSHPSLNVNNWTLFSRRTISFARPVQYWKRS